MEINNIKEQIFNSDSDTDTFEIGRKIGEDAKSGQIYALYGKMAMGKTVFSKGFAKGLGITENVNSPTFTVVQEYNSGRLPLYHFDVYRLGNIDDLYEIGYTEYFYGDGVCLIEWAELIEGALPENTIRVDITAPSDCDFNKREIKISS